MAFESHLPFKKHLMISMLLFISALSLTTLNDDHITISCIFLPHFNGGRGYASQAHDFCYRLIRGSHVSANITSAICEELLQSRLHHPPVNCPADTVDQYDVIMDNSPPSPYTADKLKKIGMIKPEHHFDVDLLYGDSFCSMVLNSPTGGVLDHVALRSPQQEAPRVLCVIITYLPRHPSAYVVASTWGARCTGFLAYSNVLDYEVPTIAIESNAAESMENYWFKKKVVYKHIHANYMSDFDWILFGDDDTYVVVPNLNHFIRSDPTISWLRRNGSGVYAGRPIRLESYPGDSMETTRRYYTFYNSGCGYLLDAVALRELVTALSSGEGCGFGLADNNADVYAAQCLALRNVHPIHTKDTYGADMFHHYHPEAVQTYSGDPSSEFGNFYAANSFNFIPGLAGCSRDSVVFHYLKHPLYIQQVDHFLNHCKS